MKAIKFISDDLICGIDGGGSITKVVVTDLYGNIICHFTTDSINHYGVGIEKSKRCFAGIAYKFIDKLGCIPSVIFVGHSAFSTLVSKEKVDELTDGVFQNSKVIFHSDVYIALLGFTMGKPGAVLIAGTGSMACGIDAECNYHTVGGWGQTLGDEGSGYYIGIEGMKAAIRGYDGISEATLLTDKLTQYFNVKNLEEIIEKVYQPPIEKKQIADFALEVENAALMGDATAKKILEEAANWLTKITLSICKRCKTNHLSIIGSVVNHNEIISARLKQNLEEQNIALTKPKFLPEIGAIFGALQVKEIAITDKMMEHLLKYK